MRFDGANILWIDNNSVTSAFADDSRFRKISKKDFEKRQSDEARPIMGVPAHLLAVTYSFDEKSGPTLLFPEGGTVHKP